ncbi:hypothetical protein QQ056_07350 [Oscillatoria laete-virens NRMC-F 0139]|nr:hypothetical protein [Oscillatoria laete-virens]MDL5053359.1 hypothetical protein [Oscillatoria laete-virens NRMC-F 0139]
MPRDTDAVFLTGLMAFYEDELSNPISKASAEYILIHHLESFSLAFAQFRKTETQHTRDALLRIVELANSKMDSAIQDAKITQPQ